MMLRSALHRPARRLLEGGLLLVLTVLLSAGELRTAAAGIHELASHPEYASCGDPTTAAAHLEAAQRAEPHPTSCRLCQTSAASTVVAGGRAVAAAPPLALPQRPVGLRPPTHLDAVLASSPPRGPPLPARLDVA